LPTHYPARKKKHLPLRSEKQTAFALSKLKGNAVKDQHRNEISQHPVSCANPHGNVPSAFAVLKVNFPPCFSQGFAEAKSLLSRNRHTWRDAYQSQQGM